MVIQVAPVGNQRNLQRRIERKQSFDQGDYTKGLVTLSVRRILDDQDALATIAEQASDGVMEREPPSNQASGGGARLIIGRGPSCEVEQEISEVGNVREHLEQALKAVGSDLGGRSEKQSLHHRGEDFLALTAHVRTP